MIDIVYITQQDATKKVAADQEIYAGQPVSLNSNGELIAATATSKIFGVAKGDANKFKNVAIGEVGAYGTGNLAIVTDGIIRVKASEFGKIEVKPSGPLSETTVVKIYDDTKVYNVGDVLYVDATGLITNAPTDKHSIFARVIRPVDSLGWLEIQVSPMIATAALDLA